jgi:transcriptional regulator NrdR family protein
MNNVCNHPKGITCPKCSAKMSVSHTRQSAEGRTIRYRTCVCGVKSVTRETVIKIRFPK